MKKWEKEIAKRKIADEERVIKSLQDSYKTAMKDVEEKIQILQGRPQTASVIYQLKTQQELQKQLEATYSKMSQEWYKDIDSYLNGCYEEAFYGTMYSLHQQGIPIIFPFNQEEAAQMAAQSEYQGIKLSEKLYDDSVEMARTARQEMTRGIASNETYATIAGRIARRGQTSVYNATRIVRTESGRIHGEVRMKTITKAAEEGADIVKQWDSTIDGRTRSSHVHLDGEKRELDKKFSNGLMYPCDGSGAAAEVINCRCEMLQRARWALDKSEIDKCVGDLSKATDKQIDAWAEKLGVSREELIKASNGIIEPDGTINHSIKSSSYNGFKKKYVKAAEGKAIEEVSVVKDTRSPLRKEIDGIREKIAQRGGIIEESDILEAGKAVGKHIKQTPFYVENSEKLSELREQQKKALSQYRAEKDASRKNEFARKYWKLDEEINSLSDGRRSADALREALSEVREMGSGGLNIAGHLNNSKSAVSNAVKTAYDYYPADWVKQSVARGNLSPKKVNRGYYSDWSETIAISGDKFSEQFRVSVHELGHRMERAVPGMMEAEKAFYDRRTAGEQLKWMGKGYRKDEVTRKDDFLSPYMGKDYGETAYELVSMGFQYAYLEPETLAKDPDMESWIYGILSML